MIFRSVGICLLMVGLCHCGGTFLGGGTDGVANSAFLNATLGGNANKVIAGITCSRSTPTSELLEVKFTIYENDTEFRIFGGPNDGQLVTWECYHLDIAAYRANTRQYNFEASCNLTRLDTNFGPSGQPTATDIDERTQSSSFSFNANIATPPCGGTKSGLDFSWIVSCQRNVSFHSHFDFEMEYGCNNGTALIRQLTNTTVVGDPPVRNATTRREVTMKCYQVINETLPNSEFEETQVIAGQVIAPPASGMPLGASMFCEWCLKIVAPDTSTHFAENASVMGLYVEGMWMTNIDGVNTVVSGFPKQTQVVKNNCGYGRAPASQLYNNEAPDVRYRAPANPTKHQLTSPNCFATRKFAVVSYVNTNINNLRAINITAKLQYCLSSATVDGVNRCFGDLSTTANEDDGYMNCTTVIGRRKRSDEIAEMYGLPSEISTTVYIIPDTMVEDRNVAVKYEEKPCFKKSTFSILTACLSFLFAVVIMMSIFLACKIESAKREEKESSSSRSGFSNKGFY